uniref:Uncharacterized protein n=1 Tax=Eutreptiella gymnastica TaxID=73025 RepID=A0A7S4D2W8_9EUGL
MPGSTGDCPGPRQENNAGRPPQHQPQPQQTNKYWTGFRAPVMSHGMHEGKVLHAGTPETRTPREGGGCPPPLFIEQMPHRKCVKVWVLPPLAHCHLPPVVNTRVHLPVVWTLCPHYSRTPP